jgi:thymidylate kinase
MADLHLIRNRAWPILVAIDGPSGCGKSTLLRAVEAELAGRDVSFCTASNNDSGAWGGLIRALAKRPEARTALALATAGARAQLREEAHKPVLCDRYALSTFVYQRVAGLSFDYLYAVNEPLLNRSVTFALMTTEESLTSRRSEQQSIHRDIFKDGLSAHEEIQLYEQAIAELKRREYDIRRVDASGEVDAIVRKLAPEIAALMRSEVSG